MLHAVLVLSHAAANAMKARGRGTIVNVASVAAFVAMGSYSATKSWVVVFSEALSRELAGSGVTVTAVCPGFVHTEFHGRAGLNMSRLPEWGWLDGRAGGPRRPRRRGPRPGGRRAEQAVRRAGHRAALRPARRGPVGVRRPGRAPPTSRTLRPEGDERLGT